MIFCAAAALLSAAQARKPASPGRKNKPQFSHRLHAPLKLACTACHAGAAEKAGFPAAAVCHNCHGPDFQPPALPARRVYKLADYVVFSHALHTAAEVSCARCHGAVERRDQVAAEVRHTMRTCMACHRRMSATLQCNACHELGQ